MISARRFGRLGNELYQLAAAISYAIKHNLEWSAPIVTDNEVWNPCHFRHLVHPNWVQGIEEILINEPCHEYREIPFFELWRNHQIVLNGYYQSYKYFDFCRDEILRIFNFPYEKKEGCSVHVRRGDYLLHPTKHPVVTDEYLNEAIWYMIEFVGCYKFKFFSDDIQWCKDYVNRTAHKNIEIEFSEGKNEVEDLTEMSCMEHNILSNSTMAVWAAELNQNKDKVVIIPSEKIGRAHV